MIDRIDTVLREGVAQRIVDVAHLAPRRASTQCVRVAAMLILTGTTLYVGSSTMVHSALYITTVLLTLIINTCQLVFHLRGIDSGRGMSERFVAHRMLVLLIIATNIWAQFFMLGFDVSPVGITGYAAALIGWVLMFFGIYFRLCRNPPPRKTSKKAAGKFVRA